MPTFPKWLWSERRPVSLTVRLSEIAVKQLRALKDKTSCRSQADVLEYLLNQECERHADLPQRAKAGDGPKQRGKK